MRLLKISVKFFLEFLVSEVGGAGFYNNNKTGSGIANGRPHNGSDSSFEEISWDGAFHGGFADDYAKRFFLVAGGAFDEEDGH